MPIEWNEGMSTGIDDIDIEHKEWLRRYNEFDDAVINNHGSKMIAVALRFFKQYTEFHFPNEETRVPNYLSLAAQRNREEHVLICNKIAELQSRIGSEGTSIVEVMELKIEMEEWIVKHICKTDVEMFSEKN